MRGQVEVAFRRHLLAAGQKFQMRNGGLNPDSVRRDVLGIKLIVELDFDHRFVERPIERSYPLNRQGCGRSNGEGSGVRKRYLAASIRETIHNQIVSPADR